MHQTPDYDSKNVLQNAPEMWLSEIRYIEKTLVELAQINRFLNILEWGSGNSTIYFPKFLKQKGIPFKWIAIEHFIPWYEKVIVMLKENSLSNDVEYFLKSPTYEANKNIQETLNLDEYINFPSTLGIKFNFIFVDGRKRKECLDKANNILASNGVAVLHDAEREWYHDGFRHYVNGGEFVVTNVSPAARGGVQKLWAGRVSRITMDKRIIELLRRGKQILHEEGSLSFLKHVLLFSACLMNIALVKIAIKVLLTPGVKRRIEKTVQFYETVRLEKELDMLNRKQEVCMMNFRHYLPDTEERIERLRRVINKRPVAIILHGPSVTELEERITELDDCDICYATPNVFRPIEKHILQKINRNISLFMSSAPTGLYQEMNNHNLINFLERTEDNFFISGRDCFHSLGYDLDKFVEKYDRKLLFFTATAITSITMRGWLYLVVPSIEYPLHFPVQSSSSVLLSLAVIGEAPMVVIFGGDGGRINGRELHYRECSWNFPESTLEQSIMLDTRLFNVTMPLILEKIYKIYNLRPVDIINCSVQSHYTPFRKLSYDETFNLLKHSA